MGEVEVRRRPAVWDVPCPKCAAPIGRTCRTLASKRATDTHTARSDAYWAEGVAPPERCCVDGLRGAACDFPACTEA